MKSWCSSHCYWCQNLNFNASLRYHTAMAQLKDILSGNIKLWYLLYVNLIFISIVLASDDHIAHHSSLHLKYNLIKDTITDCKGIY